jgi:hypothetical protein
MSETAERHSIRVHLTVSELRAIEQRAIEQMAP